MQIVSVGIAYSVIATAIPNAGVFGFFPTTGPLVEGNRKISG
jgi:hypothetical protein